MMVMYSLISVGSEMRKRLRDHDQPLDADKAEAQRMACLALPLGHRQQPAAVDLPPYRPPR